MSDVQAVITEPADQLLTVGDICGLIGAHETTVRGWIRNGELTAAKFGSRIGYRIKLKDYNDFVRRRTTTGAISRLLLMGALPPTEIDLPTA
jgi:excisionase family DNA binding protein